MGKNLNFMATSQLDKSDKELYIKKMMLSIKEEKETQIFIETPYRNQQLLKIS